MMRGHKLVKKPDILILITISMLLLSVYVKATGATRTKYQTNNHTYFIVLFLKSHVNVEYPQCQY